MTDSNHSMILRRMTGRQAGDAAETPLTLSRAVRLALTKAANDTIGLVVTVTDMSEDVRTLDDMLAVLDPGGLLVGLDRAGDLNGLLALDMQFRAAVLEMQTMGSLLPASAEDRAGTSTDARMCEPVLNHFLDALPAATLGTELDGWVEGVALSGRIESSRAAGLILDDCDYRIMRLSVDLGVADRKGELQMILPLVVEPLDVGVPVAEKKDWDTLFRAAVADAPGELDALLHRFDMPLAQAHNLQEGQLVPLLGCTVNSVKLISSDGHMIADAKLGQLGGKRAVRVEPAPLPQMHDFGASDVGGMPDTVGDFGGEPDALPFAADGMADMALDGGGGVDLPLEDTPTFGEPAVNIPMSDDLMALGNDSAPDLGAGLDMAPMDLDALSLED